MRSRCSMLHCMDDYERVVDRDRGPRQAGAKRPGWTLDRLAEVAGVSRSMLVNIEQGAANPSVGILLRISDALGIGLPALVEPPHASAAA